MKYRTFTVLITEAYEYDDMTDVEATRECIDKLQNCYDEGIAPGSNFLVVSVEDGDEKFWSWHKTREAGNVSG